MLVGQLPIGSIFHNGQEALLVDPLMYLLDYASQLVRMLTAGCGTRLPTSSRSGAHAIGGAPDIVRQTFQKRPLLAVDSTQRAFWRAGDLTSPSGPG